MHAFKELIFAQKFITNSKLNEKAVESITKKKEFSSNYLSFIQTTNGWGIKQQKKSNQTNNAYKYNKVNKLFIGRCRLNRYTEKNEESSKCMYVCASLMSLNTSA